MLTPGVEYFSVASDSEAVDFARGLHAAEVPVYRVDDVAPDRHLAILGSLLSGESLTAMLSPGKLVRLWHEERDGSSVLVVRIPDSVTRALRTADTPALAGIARRALSYPEFAGADEGLIQDFLTRLAETATHEALYSRLIVTGTGEPSPRRPASLVGPAILAGAGIVASTVLIAVLSGLQPGVAGMGAIVGVAALVPLVTAVRGRAVQRVADLDPGAAVIRIATNRRSPRALTDALVGIADVSAPAAPVDPRAVVNLNVDPAGVVLRAGVAEVARIPRTSIIDVAPGSATVRFSWIESTRLPTLEFELRAQDGGSRAWSLPLITIARTKPDRADAEIALRLVRQRLGMPD